MSKIPASLSELFIHQQYAIDPTTRQPIPDAELEALTDALRTAREVAEQAETVTGQVMASQLYTVAANRKRAREFSLKLLESATRKIDVARSRAQAAVDKIEQSTATPPPPKDATQALLHGEIRSALARMTDKERRDAISGALGSGDETTVAALLHGPTLLTGVGPMERESYRRTWQQKRFPAEVDRARRLRSALTATDRGGSLLISFVSDLTDANAVATADALEQAAQKALTRIG